MLIQHTCPGLVSQIEAGEMESEVTYQILEEALQPMLEQGIDTVVLGCTHYPFVIPLIQHITGPDVRVIDPAPAVARQVQRLLVASSLLDLEAPLSGDVLKKPMQLLHFCTTGSPSSLENMLPALIGENYPVEGLSWSAGKLISL